LLKEGIAPKTMPYVVVKRKGLEEWYELLSDDRGHWCRHMTLCES
jgi:hypothetical protein